MRVGEHGLRDHLRLLGPVFGLIAAVWLLRLVLDYVGAPPSVVHLCSVNVAGAIAVLVAVLLIHLRRFGGYASVVMVAFLLEMFQQVLVVSAILFSHLTGIRTVYAAPEYSFGLSYSRHVLGHLTLGLGFGTLFGAAMGCLLFWMLRRVVPVTGLDKRTG